MRGDVPDLTDSLVSESVPYRFNPTHERVEFHPSGQVVFATSPSVLVSTWLGLKLPSP